MDQKSCLLCRGEDTVLDFYRVSSQYLFLVMSANCQSSPPHYALGFSSKVTERAGYKVHRGLGNDMQDFPLSTSQHLCALLGGLFSSQSVDR